MKNLKIILIALLTLVINTNVNAQGKPQVKNNNTGRFYVQTLTKQLSINEEDKEEFAKLYLAYFKESRAIKASNRTNEGKSGKDLTDKELKERIMLSFEKSEQAIALKRDYYTKFEKILSPRQIIKMYKTEETIRTRINSEKTKRTARAKHPNKQ